MDENDNSRFLTVEEVAFVLRKKERTIREWCDSNTIPHYKVGNSLLFKEHEISKWVDRNCKVDIGKSMNGTKENLTELLFDSQSPRLKLNE